MTGAKNFDVIIVGGSYSGLAAGMALGRALRKVLIIDSGEPCNRQTPYSHNFLTRDGEPPKEITMLAKQQVERYKSVSFLNGVATNAGKIRNGFDIQVASSETFHAGRLIFATGIRDILPDIIGITACWGITVLHCPYCHGYEVRNQETGILANGDYGFEFSMLISNWTNDLTLFTNGTSTLTAGQISKLEKHHIRIVEKKVKEFEHTSGYIQNILFSDGTRSFISAMYAPSPFIQHCRIPEAMGCELTDEGYFRIDAFHKSTVDGIFCTGDNVTRMRTVANAVSMGTTTGMMVNREIILEEF